MAPLDDIRVVDFSTGISGPYVTKLFADAGADVIKVETAQGDPLRRRAVHGENLDGRDAALFRYLNAGKRSVVGAPTDSEILELVGGADLMVESGDPELDVKALRASFPHLVVLTLSPYGRSGPYSGRPTTTFVVEAESGTLALHGKREGVPFQTGGRLFDWTLGIYAAVGAMAAVLRAARDGCGEHVDATMLEAATLAGSAFYFAGNHALKGEPELTEPVRFVEVPSIEPTEDGWVGVMVATHQQFSSFVTAIGHPELAEDPNWTGQPYRSAHVDEWNEFVHPWTRERSSREIIELLTLLRVPNAPVCNGHTVLEHEQFEARGIFARSPDGDFVQPQPPALIDGERSTVDRPAPRIGEHTNMVEPRQVARTRDGGDAAKELPFEGMRVLDATAFWAGPGATLVFACLGADVIKLESIQRPDGLRLYLEDRKDAALPRWWERGYLMLATNMNKRDVTLDLASSKGRALLEELVKHADVLVENYSPRVFDNLGLTRERILELNPRIVFVRMPAFGLDGPWRDNVGFAQTMEQVTGIAWLTGHRDDQPRIGRGPCDTMGGYHAAFAALTALHRRERTGKGGFVESAFVESILNCTAEVLLQYSAYGNLLERDGNRSAEAAPQGVYACAGWEEWLALSVTSDTEWQALKEVLGNPAWADESDLDTHDGRRSRHDLIDEHLSLWTAEHAVADLVERLVAAGIPAGTVWDPRLVTRHPQLEELGFFQEVDHPVVGRHPVPSLPFRFGSVKRWIRRGTPTLGEHNAEVLSNILGLSEDEVNALAAEQVIGDTPPGI